MAENIPIRNITQSGIPSGTSYIVFDDGSMKKGLVSDLADGVRPVASQSEAQTGSDNTKTMTPLRVKDSIASEVGSTVQAHASNLDNFAGKTAPTGDVLGTTDAQTLTNKTLTAPAISSPTGLVKADVGLGNVDNTSDATKNSAAATLTNKTIDGGTNTLQNIPNAALTNSGVAISGHALALGGSLNLAAADVSGLATVATSGSYADLSGTPTIPAAQVNSDWSASTGVAQILNKPTLGALAAKDKAAIADIDATGTPSSATFLRGDGAWAEAGGGGGSVAFYDTASAALDTTDSIFRTSGKLAIGDFGGATYIVVDTDPSEEGSFVLTSGKFAQLAELVVTPQMFLESGDATDDQMFNRFATYLSGAQAKGLVPSKEYTLAAQVTFTAPSAWRTRIDASGAVFKTTGAIILFKVTGGGYSGGIDFVNFAIDVQGNTTVGGGWTLIKAGCCHLIHPIIKCGGTQTNFIGIYVGQSDASDPNTGSFWNAIEEPQIFSTTTDTFTFAIYLEGAANATTVRGGNIASCDYGVFLSYLSTSSYSPNAILVTGVAFEDCSRGVHFHGATGTVDGSPYGLRVMDCRSETVDVFLEYSSGVDTETSEPTIMSGNTFVGTTTKVSNPNGITIKDYNNLNLLTTTQVARASAVALTTGVNINLVSLNLGPGEWDLSASSGFTGSATAANINASFSTTSGIAGGFDSGGRYSQGSVNISSFDTLAAVPTLRLKLNAASTTIYMVVSATFGSGAVSAYGTIAARKVR